MYTLVTMAALGGHRALVTGASRNLGAEIATRLATAGAAVAVNYRVSRDEADAVVALLPEVGGGGGHCAVGGDVADPADAARVVAESEQRLGGSVDILVNNVGPFASTPFVDLAAGDFDRVWNANVRATYLVTRAVALGMQKQTWGRVVNLAAVSAFVRNRSVYSLANAAIITLTEELAVELAPEVNVNAVAPGQIHESLEELRDHVPDWADLVIKATPKGRLVTRREIADIVVLLCSPLFDAVTGVTVPVDGGLRLNTL